MPRPAGAPLSRPTACLQRALFGLAAAALTSLAPPAAAQTAVIPDELIAKTTTLAGDEMALVEGYVAEAMEDLRSTEPAVRNRGRSRLASPMGRPAVSVAFRQAYSDAVVPGLRDAAGSTDELLAAPALFVVGRVATQDAWNVIDVALGSESVSTRIAAAGAAQALMRAVQDSAPAIQPAAIARMTARLDEAYAREHNAWVADALSRALAGAGAIARPEFKSAADAAWAQLAITTGARHKAAGSGPIATDRTRLTTLRVLERLAGREVLAQVTGVNPAVAREAAGLAGIALGVAAQDALRGTIAESDREHTATLVAIAGSVIDQAHLRLGAESPDASALADVLRHGEADREFGDRAKRVVLALSRIEVPRERLEGLFE